MVNQPKKKRHRVTSREKTFSSITTTSLYFSKSRRSERTQSRARVRSSSKLAGHQASEEWLHWSQLKAEQGATADEPAEIEADTIFAAYPLYVPQHEPLNDVPEWEFEALDSAFTLSPNHPGTDHEKAAGSRRPRRQPRLYMPVTPQDEQVSSAGSPFDCSSCPRRFHRACDLKRHSKSHERPVKCPFEDCKFHERGWSNEKELDRHVNDKHTLCPQMFSCNYPGCDHKSKRASNLKQHERNKHNMAHQRNRFSGSYVCPSMGCGLCRNELDTGARHGQVLDSSSMDHENGLASPQPIHQSPFVQQTASTIHTAQPFILARETQNASRNLAAITMSDPSAPLAFPMLRSPDHNANLQSKLSKLQHLATTIRPTSGRQSGDSIQATEPFIHTGSTRSILSSVISTYYSDSCAVDIKVPSSAGDRNETPSRKRKRCHVNASRTSCTGIPLASELGDGEDESVNDADGDSEYDPSDGPGGQVLPPTEFNNSSGLLCPFKHENPAIYSSVKDSRHKQCEVERKPISQITRHLTRKHGLSTTGNCISSFDAPVIDDIQHPAASLCKNCWKTFGVRADSDSHFAQTCPRNARKALSRPEKYRLLCKTFCVILPVARSPSTQSAVAQRRARKSGRHSMLTRVSSVAVPEDGDDDNYDDDVGAVQDSAGSDGQIAALQAQIATIDRRIEELTIEKSDLVKQVDELTAAEAALPRGPVPNVVPLDSLPNSQATERDALVGGMDRLIDVGADMGIFLDDANIPLIRAFDGDGDLDDATFDNLLQNME